MSPLYDGTRNMGIDKREVPPKSGGVKRSEDGCWLYKNNSIQNRLVHCIPRLLEQKMFLIGKFTNDFFKKATLNKN